ncbi:MAG: hypothetical protein FWF02_04820 [Micrococcales bacterium]|nr:hypothetical protein [Micrococcales bacterium]MCL2667015.1 hypothetical protein [Micrococcales bacterium]
MLSGDVLSQWLQRRHGSVVQGPVVSLSRSGLLRVSESQSRPARVELPVVHGGQAAVVRVVDPNGAQLALRVQAVSSAEEKSRQMERLVNMTTVAVAARERPDRFPAVLPVVESFVLTVPGDQIPVTGGDLEYELWCDLMPWCPGDLNQWAQANPLAGRHPGAVLGAFLPLLATVRAVHEDLGIVHRDITPNNVLVDDQGRLLLADWGIAHGLAANQTSTYTQLVGNRGFSLPPEMLAGDPAVGRYTDAWYLGSLLSWMLTDQPPGPQHGPGWLPPGLPGGPAGEQVQAVVRGLCWADPRGRMDLGQAQTLLAEAAAGRASVSTFAPAPSASVATTPLHAGSATYPTTRYPAGTHPTANHSVHAFAQAPSRGQYPIDDRVTSPSDRPAKAGTGRRVAVATAVVVALVLVAGSAWGVVRLAAWASTNTPAAAPSSHTPTRPPVGSGGSGQSDDGPSQNDEQDPAVSGPTYSADRLERIVDDLVEAAGTTQFTWVVFYDGYTIALAPKEPGSPYLDEFTWRAGKVAQKPATTQPTAGDVPKMLFDLTKVDWTVVEPLLATVPEHAPDEKVGYVSVHRPGTMMTSYSWVFVYGVTTETMFTVAMTGDYHNSMIAADSSGTIVKVF